MDPHYAMAKFGLESKDILRSNQKGCWHYTKYVFIFSSIIQFLIILGLVLFMLYGNAHVGTEERLRSVEKRYENLNLEYIWLQGNFSVIKNKLGVAEKQNLNCSQFALVQSKQIETMNRTIIFSRMPISPDNRRFEAAYDRLNMTCSNERLQSNNYRLRIEAEYRQYKENCSKTISNLSIKEQVTASEKSLCQQDNIDLRTHMRMFQSSCTSVDERFRREIEDMKKTVETKLPMVLDSYTSQSYKCRIITDEANMAFRNTLDKLKLDVNTVEFENSQLKVAQGRTSDELRQCKLVKETVTDEKNKLAAEKSVMQKELTDKTNDLNKSYAQYVKIREDLDACQKSQFSRFTPYRPPGNI